MFAIFALLASIGVWLLAPWLMLQRQVRWRPLLTGAVLTGVAHECVRGNGVVVDAAHGLRRTSASSGSSVWRSSLVTWLSGAATIIVVSACAAPVLAEDTGWIGRLARGSDSPELLVEGALPSFAPPTRAMTLRDAIGANRDEDDEDDD